MNMSLVESGTTKAGIRFCQGRMALVALMIFIGLGLSSGGALAQKSKAADGALEAFDHNNFDSSATVDNKWFPLQPGTQLVYKGFTQEDEKRVPARVVQTVTDLTKVVNGVRLVEIYEDGDFKGSSAWIAGMDGSSPGIMMKVDPRPGTPSYSQGYAPPPFNWTDRATVEKAGQKVCVAAGCYKDVLVIVEGSKGEGPDAQQLKYYAPGVGYIKVGWRGKGEKLRETLELAEIVKLTPDALAKARAEALEIEKRAYLYGRTPPAELMKSATNAKAQ